MTWRPTAAAPKHLLHRFEPSAQPARRSATSYCPVVILYQASHHIVRLLTVAESSFRRDLASAYANNDPRSRHGKHYLISSAVLFEPSSYSYIIRAALENIYARPDWKDDSALQSAENRLRILLRHVNQFPKDM
jgi:hypothetical protein